MSAPPDAAHPAPSGDWRGDPDPVAGSASFTPSARRFRDVMGTFATGLTVITALSEGEPVGLTCQSFCSVSLDPPMVLFVAARTSRTWPRIRSAGAFSVNVLAADQAGLAAAMASPGVDKFAGIAWTSATTGGAPHLTGALSHVDCTVHAVHDAGDHEVVLGLVQDVASDRAAEPLLFHRGRYRQAES